RSNARAPIGEQLVEIRLEPEAVAPFFRVQVIAGLVERLQALLDASEIDAGLANPQTDLRDGGGPFLLPSIRLEEDRCRHLPVEAGLLHSLRGLSIETKRMSFGAAGDIRCDRCLKSLLAKLLEHGCSKHRIVERSGPQGDKRVLLVSLVTLMVRTRDPKSE